MELRKRARSVERRLVVVGVERGRCSGSRTTYYCCVRAVPNMTAVIMIMTTAAATHSSDDYKVMIE